MEKIVCGGNFTTNLIKDNINDLIDESVLVKGDVTTLQSDVATLEGDVTTLQTDSTSLRTDVDSLKENTTLYNGIKTLPQIEGTVLNVRGFYADTSVGGGQFYYNPLKDKTEHNGGTVIAPEAIAAWDGSQGDLATLLDWSGTGSGCFVRLYGGDLLATFFGISEGLSESSTSNALNKFHSVQASSYYLDYDGVLSTNTAIVFEEKVNVNYKCGKTVIRSSNTSESVFRISGRRISADRLPTLGYNTNITLNYGTNTDETMVALELTGLARSRLGVVTINHAGLGMKLRQSAGFGWPDANNLFSVTFDYIDITDISYQFFDIRPWQGGNTGSVISSIYMNNNDVNQNRQACVRLGDIGGCSEMLFSLMNCEHVIAENLLRFSSDADTVDITTLHIEGVELASGTREYFYLNNDTKLAIGSLCMTYNHFDQLPSDKQFLFRLGLNTNVNITNFKERSSIITGSPHFKIYRFGATEKTNSYISISSYNSGSFSLLLDGEGDSSLYRQPPVIRIEDKFPIKDPLILNDTSTVWNAKSATSRTIIYKNQTTVRTFSTLETGRFAGATVHIINSSDTYNVNATLGLKSEVIPPNSKISFTCDGEDWY